LRVNILVMRRGFRREFDGEGGFIIALQNLRDPKDDILQVPIRGELEHLIPLHAGAIFP